jgi:hypothetical protein
MRDRTIGIAQLTKESLREQSRNTRCLALSESFDDEGEGEEAEEDDIELLEAGEDAAVAFHASEEAFDLIAFLVESAVVAPGIDLLSIPSIKCRD